MTAHAPLPDDSRLYVCLSCARTVDPDLEPSPGEPVRCADCEADRERAFGEWVGRGWR